MINRSVNMSTRIKLLHDLKRNDNLILMNARYIPNLIEVNLPYTFQWPNILGENSLRVNINDTLLFHSKFNPILSMPLAICNQ